MCGIVGVVHRDPNHPVSQDAILRMCDAIRHRGPDDEGTFVEGRLGLGMRRLSIIDLAGGRQPIFNENRTHVVVFNGEIYNYKELRSLLLSRGHRLQTHSDTETIVHLYEDEGPDCVNRLRGMFAFALWDSSTETLLLARDRFGIKPLYYVTGAWGIAFASELKALHAVGLAGTTLDWEALDAYFALAYLPAPATPFVGVRKLEPGNLLAWRPDRDASPRQYWDLPSGIVESPTDLEDRVLTWLDESVRAHLVSDVPVAAFLSGGLDSSAVVSSMALAGDTPHAFTARYHGSGAAAADETPLAEALAKRYGARLSIVDVEPDVRNLLEPIVWALDEPHADESAVPTWLISQRVAAEYKVALTGTGGDELFAGYRRHFGLRAADLYSSLPGALRRAASLVGDLLPEPRGGGLGVHRLKRFLRGDGATTAARYLALQDRLSSANRSTLYSEDVGAVAHSLAVETFERHYDSGVRPRGLGAALYLDYKTYLPDDLLHLADRISMAHSLELRVPFIDHRFVDHAFRLSDWARVGWGRPKRLLRQALRSRLPAEHFAAPKRGFVGPTAMWLRHELRDVLIDELSAERLARLGQFRPESVTALLDDHFARRQNHEGILWSLLCFSTWHRLYVEQQPASIHRPPDPIRVHT